MQRLRKRPRIDTLGAQQRAGSARWGRFVYLALLTALVLSLIYYLIGNSVVLSADGTVLRERHAVDASFPARITEVYVKEGQTVERGTPLVRLESFEMLKTIADLTLRDDELAMREGQLRSRMSQLNTLLPLAERSARESAESVTRLDNMRDPGVLLTTTKTTALRDSLQASERVADLKGQSEATRDELAQLARSRSASTEALGRLKTMYDEGLVRALAAGVVGARVPVPGKVVVTGENMMEVNAGQAYVLAYLPDMYLFNISEGMTVTVTNGNERARGRIESLLAVADALPAEFQNMFRPRDRSRLMRVVLDGPNPFAVSQKVWVSGCAFGYCWSR